MNKNFLIIHYNTPYLTECLVRSINLFVKDAIIYIFDNSDKNPFINKFENVKIIDNTQGQIINFDKWLEQYPNRHQSGGKRNYWGSAKHCYSVEKAMEIIDENFILLDSDVLLKKDCSDLFQEDCIYVGEPQIQKTSSIGRLLPFMCFINTKMAKQYDIHYFDDNFMHGLRKTLQGDMYDTGAIFYKNSLSLKHHDIFLSNYIIHYNNASWMDTTLNKHNLSVENWLGLHKKLWSNEKNKKVVYTCITSNYDSLIEPTFINTDFDYICFTDNMSIKSSIWEIRPLPKETKDLSQVKKQRYVKINPHKLLSDYELSIWVDGNVEIKGDLNELIDNIKDENISIYVPQHPQRNCIYKEANAVLLLKKDVKEIVNPQIEKYRVEGFPENYGLLQSNILIRYHNNKDCIKLMEDWFEELKNNSHRDQLSFNYVLWKNQDIHIIYLDKTIYKSKWFKWNQMHTKNKHQFISSLQSNQNQHLHNVREKIRQASWTKFRNMPKLKTYMVGLN